MKKEIDCEFTSEIVCPYCGYEHSDSWEYQDSEEDFECGHCGKKFYLEVEHSTTYTSSKNEAKE